MSNSFVHCISNYSEGHIGDSFDFDYGGNWSTALFNTCHNEQRLGIFIEETASNNFVVGNTITGSAGNGIGFYNSNFTWEDPKFNENNLLVGNTVDGPSGFTLRHANNTLVFNNILYTGSFTIDFGNGNNYLAQNVSLQNNYNFGDLANNPFFTAPYYSYSGPVDPDCLITGDVDNNGVANIVDALLVAQYYVDLAPGGFIQACADVDCSGDIDIIDALLIARYYVNLIPELPWC
jgi:hypothetical protein